MLGRVCQVGGGGGVSVHMWMRGEEYVMFAAPSCNPPRRWYCCCFVGYDVIYQCTDCRCISAFMFETFHNVALRGQPW